MSFFIPQKSTRRARGSKRHDTAAENHVGATLAHVLSRATRVARDLEPSSRFATTIASDWQRSSPSIFLLALFPALLFLVALIGYLPIENALDEWLAAIARVAPSDVVALLRAQIDQLVTGNHASVLTLGILGAIWSSSAATVAIIGALNPHTTSPSGDRGGNDEWSRSP